MNILEEIGLTKTEALVYERLLQLGECSISALQKSLGSHPQVVYRTIESLVSKELVMLVIRKGRKHVSAEHPKKLEQLEQDKITRLKRSLPELVNLMRPPKGTLVKTSIGDDAVRALRRLASAELKRGDALMVIGGSGDRFYSAMGTSYDEIEAKRVKKGIHKKIIAFPSEKQKFDRDSHRLLTEFRYFNSYHPTTSSVNIFGDSVGIIVWASEPIVIHIRNADVALSYKNYFNEMWVACTR